MICRYPSCTTGSFFPPSYQADICNPLHYLLIIQCQGKVFLPRYLNNCKRLYGTAPLRAVKGRPHCKKYDSNFMVSSIQIQQIRFSSAYANTSQSENQIYDPKMMDSLLHCQNLQSRMRSHDPALLLHRQDGLPYPE